jgi:hypothetical protein
MGLSAGLGCASAVGFVACRVWRGLVGDLVTLDLVLVEVELEGFALDGGRLVGSVSVSVASTASRGAVGLESSSSSEDKTVFLRRVRPWAMLPADSGGRQLHLSSRGLNEVSTRGQNTVKSLNSWSLIVRSSIRKERVDRQLPLRGSFDL